MSRASTSQALPRRADLPSLTGLRAVAAGMVFVGHLGLAGVFAQEQLAFLLTAVPATTSHSAVSLFFMLSGFVLTWSMRDHDARSAFIRRRLAKIVPNHVVTWVAGLLLMVAVGTYAGLPLLLPSLVLIHSWVPNLPIILGTDGPNWSLAAELFFYCAFPFLLPAMLRIRPERIWFWIKVALLVSFAIPMVSFVIPRGEVLFDVIPVHRFWFIAFLPVSRLPDFLIGILVARLVVEGRWVPVRTRTIVLLCLAGWIVSAVGSPYLWIAPYLLPIALILGNFATRDAAGETARMGSPRMVWLGQVSFAFYLVHWLVIEYTHRLLGGGAWGVPTALAFSIVVLALSLSISWLVYRAVEVPAYRRWATSRPGPRRTEAPSPSRASVDGRREQLA